MYFCYLLLLTYMTSLIATIIRLHDQPLVYLSPVYIHMTLPTFETVDPHQGHIFAIMSSIRTFDRDMKAHMELIKSILAKGALSTREFIIMCI